MWDARSNSDIFNSNESLYCGAARIIFDITKDMLCEKVLNYDKWSNIFLYYKFNILNLFDKAHNRSLANSLSTSIFKSDVMVMP